MNPPLHHLCPCNGRMAAYPKPRPDNRHNRLLAKTPKEYHDELEKWQSSRIGYMKEPEWKEGDLIWWRGLRYRIIKVGNGYIYVSDNMNGENGFMIKKDSYREYSHYQEGQQLARDRCRFVKEFGTLVHGINVGQETIVEWQEVKEPMNPNSKASRQLYMDTQHLVKKQRKFDKFQKEKGDGAILIEEITNN